MPVLTAPRLNPLTLQEVYGVSEDFIPFLENVVWGTEGARYRLTDYGATLRHIPFPIFLTLRRQQQLIALRLVLEKRLQLGNQTLPAFYHSFFSVDPSEKGQGHGRRLAEATLRTLMPRLESKGLIYSHVEKDNERSADIHRALGYQRIGRFSAMSFSRLFPKPNSQIVKVGERERSAVVAALERHYQGYAWTDFASSLDNNNFYALKQDGELAAGVQVWPQRWAILDLGGVGGAIALKALPHIPVLRGVFNPRDFRFLKFGNTFFREGQAARALELWEGVLAMHGLKTAMLFMDPAGPTTRQLRRAGSLGLLNMLTETPVDIFAMFRGFSESEIRRLQTLPKYISPLDL